MLLTCAGTEINFSGCNTRYFNNYYVRNGSQMDSVRQYYSSSTPEFIEVTDHVIVDKSFCEWVRNEIALNWYVPSS